MCRYSLWVLGSETTLSTGDSVWRKLICDAKRRNCFHNAGDDKSLAQAIEDAKLELELDDDSDRSKLLLKQFPSLSLRNRSERSESVGSSSRSVDWFCTYIFVVLILICITIKA